MRVTLFALGFQSTPPVKAATSTKDSTAKMIGISIHAAREGGDGTFVLSRPRY